MNYYEKQTVFLRFNFTFYFWISRRRVIIDFMDIPTILYSPDGATSLSDIFYPIIPSFVCPSFKTYCGDDYMDLWTRWVSLNQMLERTQIMFDASHVMLRNAR